MSIIMNTTGKKRERRRNLDQLAAALNVCEKVNWRRTSVTSITDDSRGVGRGSLFVAVRGELHDGHSFIDDAVRRGASALVCQNRPSRLPDGPVLIVPDSRHALSALAAAFYETEKTGPKVIGITGTDGKTTTSCLIHALLNGSTNRAGLLGTLKYDLGTRTLESTQTTPHPLTLHSMLREMSDAGSNYAVMEVSSHSLVHRRVAHVPFDMAVLTNVTEDHLDFHGTLENYIRAKGLLFEQLSADAVAVLNADCPVWKRYAEKTRASVLTYGIDSLCDIKLAGRTSGIDGTRMFVRNPFETYEISTRLVGDFNCENILACAAVGFAAGIGAEEIQQTLQNFNGVPGRLEKVTCLQNPQQPSCFVDYAHTPDALRKILTTLKPLTRGQLICVFGCGGDRERQKRPKMGHIATSVADIAIMTADNSRSEQTEDIIDEILGGVNRSGGRYLVEPDRRRAIEKAMEAARSSDDVIVVCGKGAEQFQYIGNAKIPFDDRQVCRQIMENCGSKKRKRA